MRPIAGGLVGRARRCLRADFESDPYLPYILGLAALLSGFWFWHRVPNFATRDERWRLVDPMSFVGTVAADPSIESALDGLSEGRTFGATFYLFGLALVPVFVAAFLTGRIEAFVAMPEHASVDLWAHWQRTPRWIWTWSIVLGRLVVVALAVGCVYVTYRIGTTMRDRATGRLAALLCSLTWGVLVLAHEVGEDVPALFFVLLVVYWSLRYAETGDAGLFLAACLAGGVAIALKLTTAVVVALIAVAFLLRVGNAGDDWRAALVRPRMLAAGAALGAAAIFVGFPTVIADGLDPLVARIQRGASGKTDPHGWRVEPTWWWFLRSYLGGLGLPLFVASVGALAASLPRLFDRSTEADAVALALVGLAAYGRLYSNWAYVRVHHLLPTFPLLAVLVAAALVRLRESRPGLARPLIAVLLVTSGLYAGAGVLGYAAQPRDGATDWLRAEAGANATVETYPNDPQETAVPHDVTVYRPSNRNATPGGANPGGGPWLLGLETRCPDYVQLHYYESVLVLAPDDWSERARRLGGERRRQYVRDLLAEDTYPYRVAATFGSRPAFLDGRSRSAGLPELVEVGLVPRTLQYGDPQDMGVDQYTVILERNGRCTPSEAS
ncbi:glycosyltransferase family 39 protein [Halosimplex rubrum]|uniref:Glycosyltransferase family 39 protein n=1 Tax=Halosimplex rubrum TaxID=869889 RepID=A0A7D5SZP0_9EURY|nr:glycosyltransferase family 39 protein [Halosimplex rubrum]QLH77288.1 glycosyltransferase family 39 protein [Halosimplex rubrum]